jgi:hypothetical protein
MPVIRGGGGNRFVCVNIWPTWSFSFHLGGGRASGGEPSSKGDAPLPPPGYALSSRVSRSLMTQK